MKIEFTSETQSGLFGDWSRKCRVSGRDFHCSVRRGKAVRIPYKPRGRNMGWQWHGSVYCDGKCLFSGKVPKSIGVRGLLIEAGIEE
jgi:hypothetical protein